MDCLYRPTELNTPDFYQRDIMVILFNSVVLLVHYNFLDSAAYLRGFAFK